MDSNRLTPLTALSTLSIAILVGCSGPVRPNPLDADVELDADAQADGDVELDADQDTDDELDADQETDGETDAEGDPPACGNGRVEAEEACDDGNEIDWDGCTGCAITEFLAAQNAEWPVTPGDIAIRDDRSFVVVWSINRGLLGGVYAHLFDAGGHSHGEPFPVFTDEDRIVQEHPAVAMVEDGSFVIAWAGWDSDQRGIWARHFDEDGTAPEPELIVNDDETGEQISPDIAASSEGFLVAWNGTSGGDPWGIGGRLLDASGDSIAPAFGVNSYLVDMQQDPSGAEAPDGRSVVVWWSAGQDPDGSSGVYARCLEANGEARGEEFRVNTAIDGVQGGPSVAMAADGSFVVVWHTYRSSDESDGIYGQRYGADCSPDGDELRIDPPTFRPGAYPKVSMAHDGRFVVVWYNYFELDSDEEVFGQLFDGSAEAVGDAFLVNTYTLGRQWMPSVSMAPEGSFVVLWSSTDQVGEGTALFAQRFSPEGEPLGVE